MELLCVAVCCAASNADVLTGLFGRVYSSAVDIQKLTNDLIRAGVTQVEIAKHLDVEQPTISRYASGDIKTCSYAIGKSLIELHLLKVPQRGGGRRGEART